MIRQHHTQLLVVEFDRYERDVTGNRLEQFLDALGDYRFNPVVGERSGFLWIEWLDGSAVRDWLESLDCDAPSGDLFARLKYSPVAQAL